MTYEHYLEKWMSDHYTDPSIVKYDMLVHSYYRNDVKYCCTKYSFETPYNILKLHIEESEEDPNTIFVCISTSAKLQDDPNTLSEKTLLEEYLKNIREKLFEHNIEITDEYYEEQQLECAIEYAMDHC
jgi:hypothetical protein